MKKPKRQYPQWRIDAFYRGLVERQRENAETRQIKIQAERAAGER